MTECQMNEGWKEVVVACAEVLSRYLSSGTEGSKEKLRSG
jgi:hypothetical protein